MEIAPEGDGSTPLRDAVADTLARLQNDDDIEQVAVGFHHRIVFIHPFPNGNGRWARLSTDVLLESVGRERFTWGRLSNEPGKSAGAPGWNRLNL